MAIVAMMKATDQDASIMLNRMMKQQANADCHPTFQFRAISLVFLVDRPAIEGSCSCSWVCVNFAPFSFRDIPYPSHSKRHQSGPSILVGDPIVTCQSINVSCPKFRPIQFKIDWIVVGLGVGTFVPIRIHLACLLFFDRVAVARLLGG